jgi:hypothetical protein
VSYNAAAPAGQPAVPGHVFEVTWDGVSALATFTSLDGTGRSALGDLPVNAMVRDDATGAAGEELPEIIMRRCPPA